MSFLVFIGIADAVVFDVDGVTSVGEGREMPVGDAVDDGKIKSSMFIGSGSTVFDESNDSRNFAIPDGGVKFCRVNLRSRHIRQEFSR